MTTANKNNVELNENELEQVNGGLICFDGYDDTEYEAHGVKHEHNWFTKDVYTLPDGTVTDYDGAVEYMKQCNATMSGANSDKSRTSGTVRSMSVF